MCHVYRGDAYKVIHFKKLRKESDQIPLISLGKNMESSVVGNIHYIFIFQPQEQCREDSTGVFC